MIIQFFTIANWFHRLPTDSTGCQPIPPAANWCQPCSFTVNSSWRLDNQWHRLATSGIRWQPGINVKIHVKPYHTSILRYPWVNKIVMGGVQMCASPHITFCCWSVQGASFEQICRIWKTRATPGFIFSRLQYSKYLAAVRVTKGDKMWQRWTPVPPIWLYERGLLNSMTLDDMHIYGMPSS